MDVEEYIAKKALAIREAKKQKRDGLPTDFSQNDFLFNDDGSFLRDDHSGPA
jgi:hypothetical protein